MMRIGGSLLSCICILPCLVLGGCSGEAGEETGEPIGTGNQATATVNSTGGMIALEGAVIELPAGAVEGDTEITITSTTETPQGEFKRNSPVYRFEPAGFEFKVPVTVRLAWVGTPDGTPQIYWTDAQGTFKPIGGTIGAGKVTAEITHFSRGFVGTTSALSPDVIEDVPLADVVEPDRDVAQPDVPADVPVTDPIDPPEDSVEADAPVDDATVDIEVTVADVSVDTESNDVPSDLPPPGLTGVYGMTTSIDLASGLPPSGANSLNALASFFVNPSATTLLMYCANGRGGICEILFTNPESPSVDALTATGSIALGIMDANLAAMLESNCPFVEDPSRCDSIWYTTQDIGNVLKTARLQSTFAFTAEPDDAGDVSGKGQWHTLLLNLATWRNCPQGSVDCGTITASMNALIGKSVSANFTATVEPKWTMDIQSHTLDLKYGELIAAPLEKFLLPTIFGNGADGLPSISSYEQLMAALMGGKACLTDMSCCSVFATQIVSQVPELTTNLLEGACDAVVQVGGTSLRESITGLDAASTGFSLSTSTPCALTDTNKDEKFDAFGSVAATCEWSASVLVGGGNFSPVSRFWGIRE